MNPIHGWVEKLIVLGFSQQNDPKLGWAGRRTYRVITLDESILEIIYGRIYARIVVPEDRADKCACFRFLAEDSPHYPKTAFYEAESLEPHKLLTIGEVDEFVFRKGLELGSL